MEWPDNPFWEYALELYGRTGVEQACLGLQGRHGLDVNLVLLCCWLANRGVLLDEPALGRMVAGAEHWQAIFVRPLRAVRSRLKDELKARPPGSVAAHCPELTSDLRRRALALEIDGERLEQLLLAALAAELAATEPPGIALAVANLRRYRRFAATDRTPLTILLQAAFPEAPAGQVARALDGLAD